MRIFIALLHTIFPLLVPVMVRAQDVAELRVLRDQGFVDIDLTITNTTTNADGVLVVKAEGKSQGRLTGFYLELLPGWKSDKPGNSKFVVQWGRVRIRSLGPESDRFVALLAKEYAVKVPNQNMASFIEFPAVCLEGNPSNVGSGPVRMKLFYEGKTEENYAEVYANVDLTRRRLEFHEKDPAYRTPVIHALLQGN